MEKPIQTIFNPSKKSHNSQALNLRINENQGDDDPWFNYIPPDLSDSSKTKRNSKLLKQILKSANEKENIPHHHNLNYTNPEAQKSRNSNESKTFEVDFEEFPEKKINDTSPNIFFEISPQTMIINNEIPKNTQKIIDLSNNINMNINKATHSIEKKIKSKNQSKILDTQFISPNELTECTFTPITRSKSQEKRSLKEFLDSQTKFQKQQEAKIKNIKSNLELSYQQNYTFQPEICPQSKKIVMSKSSNNLQNIENPEITPPSTPLGNRLLNLSGTSKRNNYLLENKFKKLFENSMNELQITEKLDFNQIHQVLTSFGIIQSLPNKSDVNNKLITELWKTLNGDQQDGILRSNFYLFLLIVLRLNFPSKPYNTNIRNETNTFIGNFDEKGKWVIGFSEDVKKLQKKFEIFYLNKLSNDNNSKKKETSSNKDSKQHRPSISPISKVLAEHHREKLLNEILFLTHNGQTLEGLDLKLSENKILNNIDLMVIQKKIQTLHHHFLQEEKKNKERKQCTFTPAFKKAGGRSRVNSVTTAHNYNTKNKIKINKDPLQIEFEKYKKECTFKPEILKKNTICNSNKTKIIPFIRNEKKTIERIRKAQKEKEFMESCRQRGAHSSHLSRRKCETNTLNTTTCINSLYEQKEIMEEKKQENMPLLFVDVNLGENKSERIVIYKGDKTEELAKKFCNYHNLNSSTECKLKNLLDEQLSGVLTRISEEYPISDDENLLDLYNN